jgi:hypothetical protein
MMGEEDRSRSKDRLSSDRSKYSFEKRIIKKSMSPVPTIPVAPMTLSPKNPKLNIM